jgi:hypothetical protein
MPAIATSVAKSAGSDWRFRPNSRALESFGAAAAVRFMFFTRR